MKIIIGTRGSELALYQANWVKSRLPHCNCELKIIETKGDKILDRSLNKIGDKGLFTKELEEALSAKEIHLAVHSLKDLPTKQNPELPIIAITEREEPFDCFVFSEKYSALTSFINLPLGSVIGTSSLRRVTQLKSLRSDFQFIPLRGNVGTRLRKISEGVDGLAAGVLAVAGLKRLQKTNYIHQVLTPELCLPSPGQGALAIQIHESLSKHEPVVYEQLLALNHTPSAIITGAERAALRAVDGGCQTPFGAYAEFVDSTSIKLSAVIGDKDCSQVIRDSSVGLANDFDKLGLDLGERLKNSVF